MTNKWKVILNSPRIWNWNRRARKFGKKWVKYGKESNLSSQWRNDYILKLSQKYLKILGVNLTVKGFENLPKAPAILTPNHSSLFDPMIVIMALKNTNKENDNPNYKSVFLAKKELEKNRTAKGYLQMLNSFFVDRNNPRQALKELKKMAQFAKDEKIYQVIFPEGTRTKNKELNEFKPGAFKMAKEFFMPIVPVTINNAFSIFDLSRKGKMDVEIIFHKPIKPMNFIEKDKATIAKNVFDIVKKSYKK